MGISRNWVIGCLSTVVILGTLAAVAFYLVIVKPLSGMKADTQQFMLLAGYNERLTNKGPFTPPENNELTPEQINRFMAVQNDMKDSLGSDYMLMMERAQRLKSLSQGAGEHPFDMSRVRDILTVFQGLGPAMLHAKEIQVSALNRQGFSKDEYRWVRESTYRALGWSYSFLYLEDRGQPGGGPGPGTARRSEPAVPPKNVDLVAPLKASQEDWRPFLMLGL